MGVQTVFIEKATTGIFFNISSNNIFFLVSEEKKELSPWQILYNKLEMYLSLHLEKHFIHKKICFLMDNNCLISDICISEKDKRDLNVNIVKSNTRIIEAHKNWKVLLIKEALKIKELKPILNNGLKASKELELF